MLQPSLVNVVASQSRSSGWVGGSPWVPKSSLVKTRPRPKNCSQNRFTATRAVSGILLVHQPAGEAEAVGGLALGRGGRKAGVAA